MKNVPDETNEVHQLSGFSDSGRCRVTPVAQFDPAVALAVVTTLSAIVQRAHLSVEATSPGCDGIVRAQTFEEGDVYMLSSPYQDYVADRYLMDFYDVEERGLCSRLHLHTGIRYVRMMTGPGTSIVISSLSPFDVTHVGGVTNFELQMFTDIVPDTPDCSVVTRHNLVVDPNSWVDVQVPRGVSHQFNAIGGNAVIDSVHPEESLETLREQMSGYKMMAQTIFLADELPSSDSCSSLPGIDGTT